MRLNSGTVDLRYQINSICIIGQLLQWRENEYVKISQYTTTKKGYWFRSIKKAMNSFTFGISVSVYRLFRTKRSALDRSRHR